MTSTQALPIRMDAENFITKWPGVKASGLSTSQSFLLDLCEFQKPAASRRCVWQLKRWRRRCPR